MNARFFHYLLIAASLAIPAAASATAPLPRPDHVVIIVEENKAFGQIIGSPQAPYLNSLARSGALFTQSYAITHPSQPNYFALFAGVTNDNRDGCPATGVSPMAPNLGSELIAHKLTFAGYSETMPAAGFTGCRYGRKPADYARKHNPWVHFSNVPPEMNQPYSALPPLEKLPTVAFIIPNEVGDMHSAPIKAGDDWLKANIVALIDWAQTHKTLVIITWDEDNKTAHNHIATIFIGPMVKPGRYSEHINHYAVLRTLEAMYGLEPTGSAAGAQPITDCWR